MGGVGGGYLFVRFCKGYSGIGVVLFVYDGEVLVFEDVEERVEEG